MSQHANLNKMQRSTTKDVTESVEHKRRQSKQKLKRLGGLCSCCGSTEDDVEPEITSAKVNDALKTDKKAKSKDDSKLTTYPEVFTPPDEDGPSRGGSMGTDPVATDARQYLGRNTTERQAEEIDPVKIAQEAKTELERSSKTTRTSRASKALPKSRSEDQDEDPEQEKTSPDKESDSDTIRQSIQEKSDKMRETLPRGSSASESGKLNSGRESTGQRSSQAPAASSRQSRSTSDPKKGEQVEQPPPKESPSAPVGRASIAKKDTFMAVPTVEDEDEGEQK